MGTRMHELRSPHRRRIATPRHQRVPADRKLEMPMSINIWIQLLLLAIAIAVMLTILFGLLIYPSS